MVIETKCCYHLLGWCTLAKWLKPLSQKAYGLPRSEGIRVVSLIYHSALGHLHLATVTVMADGCRDTVYQLVSGLSLFPRLWRIDARLRRPTLRRKTTL